MEAVRVLKRAAKPQEELTNDVRIVLRGLSPCSKK